MGQITDARNAAKQPNVAGLEALQAKKNFGRLQTNLQNPKNLRAIASMLAQTPLNPFHRITNPVGGALTDALAGAGAESLRPEPPAAPPAAPPATQQSGLMSMLSNPYVLGGAGLGALGLGGYGLARYLNRKKKKRPYFE
jgi:hypothetical protein